MYKIRQFFLDIWAFFTDPKFKVEGWTSETYRKYDINSFEDMKYDYSTILKIIHHGGKIIDLGCGCGYLLKFLVLNSSFNLTPFGIDMSKEAIDEVKTLLSDYKTNFFVGDSYRLELHDKFDFILTKPSYVGDYEFKWYYEKCWNMLKPKGRLIFVFHHHTLAKMPKRKRTLKLLKEKNLQWVQDEITFAYIEKTEPIINQNKTHIVPLLSVLKG